jgi:hypothetical protein
MRPFPSIENLLKRNNVLGRRACGLLTKRRVFLEALHTHGLAGDHVNDGSVSRLQELGGILKLLAGTTVDLLLELAKLAGDVSSVAIQYRGIALGDLAGVVQDDDLKKQDIVD